jgi:hypothetical protein
MAKPPSLRQLVEQYVVAALQARGFAYEPARIGPTFRRMTHLPTGAIVQIVEFQFGVKMGSFGKFTVNLGVYSPELTYPPRGVSTLETHSSDCMFEMSTRLSHIRPPCPKGALVSHFTGAAERQSDEWWSYRGSARKIKRTFEEVIRLLEDRAEPWFQAMTTEESFRWAAAMRSERAARLQEDLRRQAVSGSDPNH